MSSVFHGGALPWGQILTHQAREDVVTAARGIADNPVHRPARITLPPRDARRRWQRGSACRQMQKLPSMGKFHFLPSSLHVTR